MNAPKLRFKEFNDEYKLININDILIEHNAGIYIEKSKYGNGTNIVGVSNLYNNTKIDGQIFRLAPLSDGEREKYILKENDIIYGESSLVPIGIAMTLATSKKGEGTAFEWHTRRFRIDNSKVNSFYLSYMLNFFYKTRNHLASVSTQTALTGITTKDFFNTKFNYPSIKEQEKVVITLDLLDKKIELQSEKIEALKLFTKNTISNELNNLQNYNIFKFKDICNIQTGKSNTQDKCDDGIYPFYIRSENIERSNNYIFDCEAVLTIGDGNIGKVFFYENGKFDCHQRVYVLNNFKNVLGKYVYYYFSAFFYKRAMSMSAKNTVDSVRMEMISDMIIKVPQEKEQIKMINLFSSLDKKLGLEQNKLDKLQELKKGLMQNMFV